MAMHFQIKCAWEEIYWLNIEIHWQTTYMCDEYILYSTTAKQLLPQKASLAFHIIKECDYYSAIFSNVTHFLLKASRLEGFLGTLIPGCQKGTKEHLKSIISSLPKWILILEGRSLTNSEGQIDAAVKLPQSTVEQPNSKVLENNTLVDWAQNHVIS
jgi:hypothetical protein